MVAEDTIDVMDAEHGGLAQAYRTILSENRTIYDHWFADRKRMGKLERRLAKLRERLAKQEGT